jgi:hypothetical protein
MRILIALLCGVALVQAAPGVSPCSLVTKAEVQSAVGGATVSEGSLNPHNKMVCDFKIGASGSNLNVMLAPAAPGDNAARTAAELKKRRINAETVAGFGDSAYTSSPGYGMQQLGVYKGSHHVIVTVMLFGSPDAKVKGVAQAVMRKALARVP